MSNIKQIKGQAAIRPVSILGGSEAERSAAASALRLAGFAPLVVEGDSNTLTASLTTGLTENELHTWPPAAAALVASAARDLPAAVMVLNLDHYKRVRSVLGRDLSKRLTGEVEARLREVCSRYSTDIPADKFQVLHLDGDEFAIVVAAPGGVNQVVALAQALLLDIARPYDPLAPQVFLTGRVAIAMAPQYGFDIETLFQKAAATVHHDINRQRNSVRLYTPGLAADSTARFELEAELGRAIRNNELELVYQPQISFSDGSLVGAEALVRWRRSGFGLVPADTFVAVAEDIGLIAELGAWVLNAAANQAVEWMRRGLPAVRVAINASVYQFRRLDMTEVVAEVLGKTNLPPSMLMLEVTESLVMSEVEETLDVLHRLRRMGVKIALDDFGTGYSSLSYLKHFSVDCLKLDQSFVRGLPSGKGDLAVVEAIVRMAKSLKLEVVAEGVETEAQHTCLKALGCDYYQGYYSSKPLTADDFTRLITTSGHHQPSSATQ